MAKKKYYGLDVRFVPTDGMNIVTKTTSGVCELISVQYYFNTAGVCDPGPEGEYSYNWDQAPQ